MRPEDFTHMVESDRAVRQALVSVWKAALAAGWVVVGDYDLSSLFATDEHTWDVKSIDICRPDLARPFVAAEPLTALCMPCSILIYADGAVTKLAAMRPQIVLPQLFADAAQEVGDLPARVDDELRLILEAAR